MFKDKLSNALYIGFLSFVAYIGLIFPIDVVADVVVTWLTDITIATVNLIVAVLIIVVELFIK